MDDKNINSKRIIENVECVLLGQSEGVSYYVSPHGRIYSVHSVRTKDGEDTEKITTVFKPSIKT